MRPLTVKEWLKENYPHPHDGFVIPSVEMVEEYARYYASFVPDDVEKAIKSEGNRYIEELRESKIPYNVMLHKSISYGDGMKYGASLAGRMENNGWIKVSERLPELETSVLLFYTIKDAPYIRVGWLVSVTTRSSGVYPEFVEVGYEPSEPTHWMELPSPPKTEQATS